MDKVRGPNSKFVVNEPEAQNKNKQVAWTKWASTIVLGSISSLKGFEFNSSIFPRK